MLAQSIASVDSFLFIGTCTLARVIAIKMELCSSSAVTTTTAEATEDQKSESKNTAGVVPSSDVDATTVVDDETASPIIKVSATNALPFSWAHGGGGEPPIMALAIVEGMMCSIPGRPNICISISLAPAKRKRCRYNCAI